MPKTDILKPARAGCQAAKQTASEVTLLTSSSVTDSTASPLRDALQSRGEGAEENGRYCSLRTISSIQRKCTASAVY